MDFLPAVFVIVLIIIIIDCLEHVLGVRRLNAALEFSGGALFVNDHCKRESLCDDAKAPSSRSTPKK